MSDNKKRINPKVFAIKSNMENKIKETFDGGVTEEQINKWKGQYGKVIRIDVVDDGDLHVGYFHRPRLETMSAVIIRPRLTE